MAVWTVGTGGDFATIGGAESTLNVSGISEIEEVQLLGEIFDEAVLIDGGGSTSTAYFHLTTADGAEFDSVTRTGARIMQMNMSAYINILYIKDFHVRIGGPTTNNNNSPGRIGITGSVTLGSGISITGIRLRYADGVNINNTHVYDLTSEDVTKAYWDDGTSNVEIKVVNCIASNIRTLGVDAMGFVADGSSDMACYYCIADNIRVDNTGGDDAIGFSGVTVTANCYASRCISDAEGNTGVLSQGYYAIGTIDTCAGDDATASTGLQNLDPAAQFVDLTAGAEDYHLLATSALIGAANDAYGVVTDMDGPVTGGRTDIGPYQTSGATSTPSGSSSGVSAVSGYASSKVFVSGNISGTATVSGDTGVISYTEGSSPGTSTVNGESGSIFSTEGLTAGSSTVSGETSTTTSTSGNTSGISTVDGNSTSIVSASGSSTGTSTVSGSSDVGATSGNSSGVATVSGEVSVNISVSGSSSGVSTVSGLSDVGATSGNSSGAATVSGEISVIASASGNSSGVSTVNGTSAGASTTSGNSVGGSTVDGSAGAVTSAQGSVSGLSTANGSSEKLISSEGVVNGASTVLGNSSSEVSSSGQSIGSSVSTGEGSSVSGGSSGTASGGSTANGSVVIKFIASGNVSGSSTVNGVNPSGVVVGRIRMTDVSEKFILKVV